MQYENLCIDCFKDTQGYEVCPHCGATQDKVPKQLNHLYPHTLLNDRYVIGRVINNGGFGVVYKAYDTKLDVIVAIKELFPTQNSMVTRVPETTKVITLNGEKGEQFLLQKERFLTEARTMSKLSSCESIVEAYDFFEENNTAYLVMEYLEGISLRDYLEKNEGLISFEETMKIIEPVAKALSAVHKEKIVHRDVSPDNVFITNDNKIKLLDFGAAKFSEDEIEKSVTVVAKPGYTPPEQYRSKAKIKPFTDVYAVGAMMYRMITGTLPEESIDRVEKDELQRPSKLGAQIPSYAEKSIMKAMALTESARFKNTDEFLQALKGIKKADFPEVELKRRKIIRWISFALVLVIIFASVFAGMFAKKSMVFVPEDCTISVWLTEKDKADEEMWNTIINDYFNKFCSKQDGQPKVEVELSFINEDSYSEEFLKAYEKNNAPDIFRSDLVEGYYSYSSDISKVYQEINEQDMTVQYKMISSNTDRFAIRFDAPVMYTNISIADSSQIKGIDYAAKYDPNSKKSKTVLVIDNEVFMPIIKQLGYNNSSDSSIVTKVFNLSSNIYNGQYFSDEDVFGSGKIAYYISNASARFDIDNYIGSDSLHAYSITQLPEEDNYYCYFPEYFSVSNKSDSNEKKAAMFLLYFAATSYDAQCDLKSSSTGLLPINSKAAETLSKESHNLYSVYEKTSEADLIKQGDLYSFNNANKAISDYCMQTDASSQGALDVLKKFD
ncbi:MAG: protein kinase [Eubacterium sp.]